MADRDDEQILLDTIAEDNSQYWVDDEGNEDPNQYLNEEGNDEDCPRRRTSSPGRYRTKVCESLWLGRDPISIVYWR
uniref:Uncharacterized protein n=1 Tax=Oryza meridionalis TaxID=40149 RepID=A0A0E0EY32_9ORYZ